MNFCKNWPSWLKGGIILLVTFLLITIILIPFGFIGGKCNAGTFFCMNIPYYSLPTILGVLVYKNFINFNSPAVAMLLASINYFLIGALIGWIIGKIKNKKI
ncbi:MAG: hypothetical protein NTW11_03825 [Candidatus Staskawiczbacteria bacterium]|nr:hypothetical protein [Candidatus Staskawiczbacteria bacterium]